MHCNRVMHIPFLLIGYILVKNMISTTFTNNSTLFSVRLAWLTTFSKMFVAAVLAFLAVAEANFDFVKVNRLANPEIIPKDWVDGAPVTFSSPVKSIPSTYLVIDTYIGAKGTDCTGTLQMSVGVGFGVCSTTSSASSSMYVTLSFYFSFLYRLIFRYQTSAKGSAYYAIQMYTVLLPKFVCIFVIVE